MDTDFLIIGGGVAGIAAGAALCALGRVTLWEAEEAFGYHASGRSAALFEESYGLQPVVALNRASRAAHEAGGWLSPRGFLIVARDSEAGVFEADLKKMSLSRIDPAEARAMLPILSEDVTRAAYHEGARDIDTDALLQAGLRAIRSAGATETGRRLTALERVTGGWRAQAGDAEITARAVIIAAGPWADGVAALAGAAPLGLTPLRRSMARIAAPGGHDVRSWPMVMGAGEGWYAKPDAGALIVSPAEEAPSLPMDAFADDMTLAEGLDRYQAHVTEPVTRPLSTWAGLRTFTPDRCLAIGRADLPDLWWFAGQGGYGFQTAPAAAGLLADLVAGRTPELDAAMVKALDPGRFA
ncbi:D-amino acid dehydrogenase small subunit [Jannaschia seosinensis]|uniref:D-amino acid dehydrogenase small subunit n=1 Tax=Jannaschia seosinensis TaxID=313367 RepID=A0A0M7B7U3_9RHOB|nr:FAD-dependent oxidoreductase [Jannaschia seosinensis]CUH33402.1 D-amino acid dehydrogenase small subunit [Jannaschia seosinensis]